MSISNIAAAINAAHDNVEASNREGTKHAIDCGRLLAQAKAMVPHGEWDAWVREHCTFSMRTAQLYMKAFRYVGDDPAKTQRVADLSLREIGRLDDETKDVKPLEPAGTDDDRATPSHVLVMFFLKIGGLPGAMRLLKMAEMEGKSFVGFSKALRKVIAERSDLNPKHFETLLRDVIDKAKPQEVKSIIYESIGA